MARFAVPIALTILSLAPGTGAAAAPLPDGLRIVDAVVEKDKLLWSETKFVPVEVEKTIEVLVGGKKVTQTVKVTEVRAESVRLTVELKGLKVTDGSGKALGDDKIAELLKEPVPVVLLSGPLPAKHRGLFKDKTVFIELGTKVPVQAAAPPAR